MFMFRNRKRLASTEFLFCYLLQTLRVPASCAHSIWAGLLHERRFVALTVPLLKWVVKLYEDSGFEDTANEWIDFETAESFGSVSVVFSYARPMHMAPQKCIIQNFYASVDLSDYAGQQSKDIALHYSTYADLVIVTQGIAHWQIALRRTMLWYQAVNDFMMILLRDHQPSTGGWLFSVVQNYWHGKPKHNGKPPPTVGVLSTGLLRPGGPPISLGPMPLFVISSDKIVLKIPDPNITNCSLEKWRFRITYLRDDDLHGKPFFMRTHSYRMPELATLPTSERPWCREQTELEGFEDWINKAVDVADHMQRGARARKPE